MKNCNHKVYNPECSYCEDVMNYCGDAVRKGYTDFNPHDDWEEMKDYYEKWAYYEGETESESL